MDEREYLRRVREGPCFVCELVAGRKPHHVVYEDDRAIAFLNRFPSLPGHVLVAPKSHREQVTGDFTGEEYVALQRVVWRVGEALRSVVETERLYVLSLGSQQGNTHVHWHLVPLPPGVPYGEQQLAAIAWRDGVVPELDEDAPDLARRLREAIARA